MPGERRIPGCCTGNEVAARPEPRRRARQRPGSLDDGTPRLAACGLERGKEVKIADGMTAAPLDRTSACLERKIPARAAPDIVATKELQGVRPILEPVRSRPVPCSPGEERVPQLDWGGTFFEDAGTFGKWLSVARAAPIDTLMEVSYRTLRTAVLLVGPPNRPRNCRYRRCRSAHLSVVHAGRSARADCVVEAVAAERVFQPGATADRLDALLPRCPQRSEHTSHSLALVSRRLVGPSE